MLARSAMFDFLRQAGLAPLGWSQGVAHTAMGSPYVGQVLNALFERIQAVVVLITGDDVVRLGSRYASPDDASYEREECLQARPNVLFEAGMAFALHPERTVLVTLGETRPFSDIYGRDVVRLEQGTEASRELLRRLTAAGCAVADGALDSPPAVDFCACLQDADLPSVFGDDIIICYGTLRDTRLLLESPPSNRFFKEYRDGRRILLPGPWRDIVGAFEIRAISYLLPATTHRRARVVVESDRDALSKLDRTLIALGSPDSNEISEIILADPRNTHLTFAGDGIRVTQGGALFRGFQPPRPKDYGMVLCLPDLGHAGRSQYICGGLGEWGTSSAAWYLAQRATELHHELGSSFGVVLEVEVGSDQSARRVYP
jgi:hypothetical protein